MPAAKVGKTDRRRFGPPPESFRACRDWIEACFCLRVEVRGTIEGATGFSYVGPLCGPLIVVAADSDDMRRSLLHELGHHRTATVMPFDVSWAYWRSVVYERAANRYMMALAAPDRLLSELVAGGIPVGSIAKELLVPERLIYARLAAWDWSGPRVFVRAS